MSNIKSIDVDALNSLWASNPGLCVIDVREDHEWKLAHIDKAHHIPKDTITNKINGVCPDKAQAIYLQCRSGGRSLWAAQQLADMGYQDLYNVEGGIMDWVRHGFDVVEG